MFTKFRLYWEISLEYLCVFALVFHWEFLSWPYENLYPGVIYVYLLQLQFFGHSDPRLFQKFLKILVGTNRILQFLFEIWFKSCQDELTVTKIEKFFALLPFNISGMEYGGAIQYCFSSLVVKVRVFFKCRKYFLKNGSR